MKNKKSSKIKQLASVPAVRITAEVYHPAGSRVVDIFVSDPYAEDEPLIRRKITHAVESGFIPEIEQHIYSRGRHYKRGEDNPVSEKLYSQSPVLRKWKSHMPTAMALYPLQKPHMKKLADGTPFDEVSSEYFMHALDGIGLRSRAITMSRLMHDHFVEHKLDNIEWLSLASGAAIPVFEAASALGNHNKDIHITLADISGKALKFAAELAKSEYDLSADIETKKINILRLRKLRKAFKPASFDAIDILGFFEYIPEMKWRYKPGLVFPGAIDFLKTAYSLLKPGGIMVFGNMSNLHPHLIFTINVVQWPLIQPRSIDELVQLIEKAGIDPSDVDIFRISDSVYYVIAIYKKT